MSVLAHDRYFDFDSQQKGVAIELYERLRICR